MRRTMILSFLVVSLAPLIIFNTITYFVLKHPEDRNIFLGFYIASIILAAIMASAIAILIFRNISNPLKHLINRAQIIATGNLEQSIDIERGDEIGQLAYSLEIMRQRLKKSREDIESWNQELEERVNERTQMLELTNRKLTDSYAELEEVTKELEFKNERLDKEIYQGRMVQMNMLPREYPEINGWDFYGASVPAPEIGGDYFDFLKTNGRKMGIAVGDVSGSGVPAAMIMAMAKSSLYTQIQNNPEPAKFFSILNKVIYQVSETSRLLTFFYGLLDTSSGVLTYSNAGHEAPFLFEEEERENPKLLKPTSPPIGTGERGNYSQEKIYMKPKDSLILYTNGVVKAISESGEEFGMERFREVLSRSVHLSSADIINEVFEALSMFCGAAQQADDITMLVIKRQEK